MEMIYLGLEGLGNCVAVIGSDGYTLQMSSDVHGYRDPCRLVGTGLTGTGMGS